MTTILQQHLRSGELCCWRARPEGEIIIPKVGRIIEARWVLDFEDTKMPIARLGIAKLVRSTQAPDWAVEFINEPTHLIRYGYRLRKDTGETVVIGDLSLFLDDLEEEYERRYVEQLAKLIGLTH